ncbi:MAG: hypothetical protein VW881_04900 [Alphaproteobacteria bacterium]
MLVVWLTLIALMTLSPQSGDRQHVDASGHPQAAQHLASVDDRSFVHTGL